LYGIRLSCALCKMKGFDSALAAIVVGSMTSSYVNDALQGLLHPLIQVVLLA